MESTTVHVSAHIKNRKNRASFIKAMSRCYYLCSESCSGSDTRLMLKELRKLQLRAPRTFSRRWSLFSDIKGSYMMGVQYSLDIVHTIHTKYVTGHSSPDTTFIRNILGEICE